MLSTIKHSAAAVLALLASVAFLSGAEPTAPVPAARQILILRNGQTIEGRISQKDGVYVIDLSDGQIRVKPADVDLVCGRLEEGYQRKRAALPTGDAHDHLELAQWCLRHDLLGPAAAELADAKAADPNDPMIAALEHRLKMALEPPSATTTSKMLPGPSNEELDRMIRGLPRGAIESFTQSVQPVLMNHCATAGCHGPQSETGLRLFRIPTGRSASRRITQRNLYSALSFVDRENPAASRLLTVPSGPHGTAKIAIFNEHQAAQYRRLVEWTSQLAGQPSTSDAPVTLNPMFMPAPASGPAGQRPQMLSQEARKARPLPAAGPGQTVKRGVAHHLAKQPAEDIQDIPTVSEQSADPFDAEAFNRRYSAQKSSPAKPPAQ
jgi:hypothetical protein